MSVMTARGVKSFASEPIRGHREHFDPDRGDTKWAIEETARRASGTDKMKQLDWNSITVYLTLVPGERSSKLLNRWLHLGWGGKTKVRVLVSLGGHWPTVGGNGFTRWFDGKHFHHFTKDQLRTKTGLKIQKFVDDHGGTLKALHMLRRPNNNYPLLWVEAIKIAARLHVVLIPELKSLLYATAAGAKTIISACKITNYPCWPMTLITMAKAKEKFLAFRALGKKVAVIFGRKLSGARKASYKHIIKTTWPAQPAFW